MTTLPDCEWPELVGRREPLHLLASEGDQSEADKAAILAERVGKALMPWQDDVQRGLLSVQPDGLLTHSTAVIIATRQSGKTLTAADLRILFGLFHRRERILYSAQRWTTAKAIYMRLKRLISARPSLRNRIPAQGGWLCSQGIASITARFDDGTESTAMFITRSPDFRGPDEIDLVIYDEAYNLTDSEMAAIGPTQLASRNPQTIYLSSAVNQVNHSNGEALTRIRARALAAISEGSSANGLYFAEYAADPPPPDANEFERRRLREDPAVWRTANASYGVIQTDSKVRKLLTELSAKDFEVEILGWGDWPSTADGLTSVIPTETWQTMVNRRPELVGTRTIAVWRSRNRKTWAVAQAQRCSDDRIHLEIGPLRSGSHTEVTTYLASRIGSWNPIALVIDRKNSAAVLEPLLIETGIEPTMINTADIAHACGGFLDAALDGRLSHSDQQILNEAIAIAAMRKLPGGDFAWTEDDGGIAGPMIAASQAHWALQKFATVPTGAPAAPVTVAHLENIHRSNDHNHDHDELDAFAAF